MPQSGQKLSSNAFSVQVGGVQIVHVAVSGSKCSCVQGRSSASMAQTSNSQAACVQLGAVSNTYMTAVAFLFTR